MHRTATRLVPLLLASTLVACSPTAAIDGHVVVAEGYEGAGVYTILLHEVTVPDAADPTRSRTEFEVLQFLASGIAEAKQARFPFQFHSLRAGRYMLAAWVDANGDGETTGDPLQINSLDIVTLDPEVETMRTATRDLYVGLSGPGFATIRGTLHRSSAAAAYSTLITVLDRPFGSGDGRPDDETTNENDRDPVQLATIEVGPGMTDVPFALFNVPPGNGAGGRDVYVLAVANVGNDDDIRNDLYATAAVNPIRIDGLARLEATGADVWIDRHGPDVGGIDGTVSLNAPLANGHLQLIAFDRDPYGGQDGTTAQILAISNRYLSSSATAIPFTVPGLRLGSVYLAAILSASTAPGAPSSVRVYPGAFRDPAPIVLSVDQPRVTGTTLEMGVGRVSGTFRVTDARPPRPGDFPVNQLAICATRRSGGSIQIPTYEVIDLRSAKSGSFELFGLEDGAFDIVAVADTWNGASGWIESTITSGADHPANPPSITILGGSREGADFDITVR